MAVANRALGGGARGALAALLLALVGCAETPLARSPSPSTPPPSTRPSSSPSAPIAPPDDSFDWHGLLVVPFGSDRHDLLASLHEVLFFRDDAESAGKFDAEDCYSSDRPPPRFVGRPADHYFLCFRNDRLNRIEAVVTLPNEAASELFAQFCAASLKGTRPIAESALLCEGQGGAAVFRARLDPGAEEAETELSIVVDAAEAPD